MQILLESGKKASEYSKRAYVDSLGPVSCVLMISIGVPSHAVIGDKLKLASFIVPGIVVF